MNKQALRDAFVKREKRFALLEAGIERARFEKGFALLESGCAGGEAAAHLAEMGYSNICAVDIDSRVIEKAAEQTKEVRFFCADACRLPFATESFQGIYSEAAFSVIPDKCAAAGEFARVLKKGSRLLINDFTLREAPEPPVRVEGIPCLEGVQTMRVWRNIFESCGFFCVYEQEVFPEYVRIALSLSRTYGVAPAEIGRFIVSSFGRSKFVSDFFSQAKMSYCQMVFEKRE